MTYHEWKELSPSEKADYKTKWVSTDRGGYTPLQEFAQFAAQELKGKLLTDPRIRDVRSAIDFNGEPIIGIITTEGNADADKPFPKEFAGIRIVGFDLTAQKQAYLNTWKVIFSHVLGWSAQKTFEWAQAREDYLNGRAGPFYHREPIYYAADAIIGEKLGQRIEGRDRVELRKQIIQTLTEHQETIGQHPDSQPSFDWELAARKILMLIDKAASKSEK